MDKKFGNKANSFIFLLKKHYLKLKKISSRIWPTISGMLLRGIFILQTPSIGNSPDWYPHLIEFF